MCEGEESDGDEYEGGVPGDQSADQMAVHCTAQQYRRYGYVPDPYAMFVYVRKPTGHGFLYIKNLQKL